MEIYITFCLATGLYAVIMNYEISKRINRPKLQFIISSILMFVFMSILAPIVIVPIIKDREKIIDEVVRNLNR